MGTILHKVSNLIVRESYPYLVEDTPEALVLNFDQGNKIKTTNNLYTLDLNDIDKVRKVEDLSIRASVAIINLET